MRRSTFRLPVILQHASRTLREINAPVAPFSAAAGPGPYAAALQPVLNGVLEEIKAAGTLKNEFSITSPQAAEIREAS